MTIPPSLVDALMRVIIFLGGWIVQTTILTDMVGYTPVVSDLATVEMLKRGELGMHMAMNY